MKPVLAEVEREVGRADAASPPFNSAHEGYAVLLEEMRELEQHVFTNQKRRDLDAMRQEAIQVAAMAVRFVLNVSDGGRGRVARAAVALDTAELALAERIDADTSLIIGLELAGALLREFLEAEMSVDDDAAIAARLSAEAGALRGMGTLA